MNPYQKALGLAARQIGQIDPEQLEAINTAVQHEEVLKSEDLAPIVDTDGDRLVRDAVYLYRGSKVRVKDWRFGAGNVMDTYYYLWFIDGDLKDRRITVDAHHTKSRKVYQVDFAKISSND